MNNVKFKVTEDREVLTDEEIDYKPVIKWIKNNLVLMFALALIVAIIIIAQNDINSCNNFYQKIIDNFTFTKNIIKDLNNFPIDNPIG